jgi:glycosyltransferase involved in cell wall biosynthesis
LHGYYLNVELLFKWIKSKPNLKVLWTLHDCWAFTGHCSHFDFINCEKWKDACAKCNQKSEYPKSIFKDNSKNNYIRKKKAFTGVKNLEIITPSNWLKEKVEQSFLKEYKVTAINNGIDLEIFKPTDSNFKEKYNLQGKKIILGVASVWTKRKGFYDFIELSKILPEEYQIVLVSVSKKQKNILPKNILGLEKTNGIKELVEIYSSAYVFANLSVEETMGLTTVEALACGTPVIVYNRTAVPEVVDENIGKIIKASEYESIIKHLNEKIATKEECVKASKKYEKERQYLKYLELYNED